MYKLVLILIVLFAFISNVSKSQQLIAINHNGSSSFYTILDSAVFHAQAGDTVYIPGAIYFVANPLIIDKELHLVGVGHNPDSTLVTGRTILTGNIQIQNGASKGSMTGVYLNGDFFVGRSNNSDTLSHYTIERCNIYNLTFQSSGGTNYCNNIFVIENVIRGVITGKNSQNNSFYNNFILGSIYPFGINNTFSNNIFFSSIVNPCNVALTGCVLENNINLATNASSCGSYYLDQYLSSCILNNNLSVGPLNNTVNNYEIGNYQSQTDTIFVNYVGSGFSYTNDYHVRTTSAGHNGGTDGTDVGVYGGFSPWKTGSVPFNPHIITKTIGTSTDSNGTLPVNIRVGAQTH